MIISDQQTINEIKALLTNQGIYRGDGYLVIPIFICNYKEGDFVLINAEKTLLAVKLTGDYLTGLGVEESSILGLICNYAKHYTELNTLFPTTATSNTGAERSPEGVACAV